MLHAAVGLIEQWASSPWLYLVLLALAALDAVVPLVPSESVVVVAGALAATGPPSLGLVVLAAAAGAVLGDHVSYRLGRRSAGLLDRGRRRRAAVAGARGALAARGPAVLVAARYVPGGRTATTLLMGAVGYPRRVFTAVDVGAALAWAGVSAGLGHLGAAAFAHDPVTGLLAGVGVALTLGVAVQAVLCRWGRGRG